MAEDLSDARVVKALGHPLRRQILLELDKGIASPKEISQRLGVPLTNISYHVGILRDLGLIALEGTTPRRGAVEHHYSARPRPKLSPKAAATLPAQARDSVSRAAWKTIQPVLGDRDGTVQARSLVLDERGERELVDAFDKLWKALDKIESGAKQRGAADETVVGLLSGRANAKGGASNGRRRAKSRSRA